MSQQVVTEQDRMKDFLALYRTERYEEQITYYERRRKEFLNAQRQAIWASIGLVFLTALAGALESTVPGNIKVVLLLIAAICPILSTSLAGYTALHGFTQQAKLYGDAHNNLVNLTAPDARPLEAPSAFPNLVSDYVQEVEGILQKEHNFWGQLVENLTPPRA